MLRYINVKSTERNQLVDITDNIQEELSESGVKSGVCYAFVPHTTAAISINEGADPSVQVDVLATLNKLIPKDPYYRHAEGNSDAHVKSSIIGPSISLPIDEGKLILGTWQSVYFCEFDGPRHRRVALKFIKD